MTTVHRRSAPVVALLVALALLAGCGSTNKTKSASPNVSTDASTDVTGASSGPVVTDGSGASAPGAPGAPSGAAAAGGPSGAGKPGSGGTAAAAGSSPVAPPTAKTSPGVTAKDIYIGVVKAENGGAANAAFGYAGIGQIDGQKVWNAVIAEVNRGGGIAGRQVKPVWYTVDAADFQTTTDTHAQRMCATFTEDNKVFAVMASTDVLDACLAKKGGVPQVIASGGPDAEERAKYPRLFSTSGIASDRMVRVVADRLHAKGYYKGAKLGVVVYTYPTLERAAKILSDELGRRGVKIAQTANIKPRANTAGANEEIAAIRSAVLKFKTEGITHVEFVADSSAWVQLNFMKAANEQQFFPRYGLSSNDGGQTLATLIGPDAPSQMKGSVSVSWFPLFDVRAQDSPDSPALARCKKLARDAGQDFSDPTRNTEAQAGLICDQLFFLDAAVERGLPNLTYDAFRLGAEKITGFPAALTFKASMSPTRHDGVGAIRISEWFTDCNCFKYTSPEQVV